MLGTAAAVKVGNFARQVVMYRIQTSIHGAAGAEDREAGFFEEPNAGQTSSLVRAATSGPVVVSVVGETGSLVGVVENIVGSWRQGLVSPSS